MFNLEEKIDFLKKINSDDYNYEKLNNNFDDEIMINEYLYYVIEELDQDEQNKHSSMLIEQLKRFLDKYMDDIDKEFHENNGIGFDLVNLACNDDLFLYFLNTFGMKLNDIIGVYINNDYYYESMMIIIEYLVKYNIKINKKSIEKNINLINKISSEQILNYLKTNYDI
jgi:hypothetical protein